MDWTLSLYKEMPRVVIPWHGEKTDFTINQLDARCKNCNTILIELRGDIHESFDVIELDIAGICTKCRAITSSRSRVNPKTLIFSHIEKGLWKDTKMKKVSFRSKWLDASWKMLKPRMLAFLTGVIFSLLVTKVNRLTLVIWGALIVLLMIISLLLGWSEARKK